MKSTMKFPSPVRLSTAIISHGEGELCDTSRPQTVVLSAGVSHKKTLN